MDMICIEFMQWDDKERSRRMLMLSHGRRVFAKVLYHRDMGSNVAAIYDSVRHLTVSC